MEKNNVIRLARQLGIGEHHFHSDMRCLVRMVQKVQGKTPCYKSDLRYSCDSNCDWDRSCKRLTATWLR